MWKFLASCSVLAACARSPADDARESQVATGFVHRDGQVLVGNDGAPLAMRGVNLGGWLLWEGWIWGGPILSGDKQSETNVTARLRELLGEAAFTTFRERVRDAYVTEADIARIAALGFDSVRVPFNHTLLERDEAPFVYDAAGFARLDAVIAWGRKHHVYVILDLHSAPAGQCNQFPEDPEPTLVWDRPFARLRTIQLWRAVAQRYRNERWVAGYDLLNEPCNGTDAELRKFYSEIIGAIRAVDSNHTVFVEGNLMATRLDGLAPRLDANMALSYHTYNFLGDQRATKFPQYAAIAAAQDVPLWVGEFGEASAAYLRSTVEMFADHEVTAGWSLWTWKRAPTANPTLQTLAIPSRWAKVIRWVTLPAFNARPTAAEAAAGASDFLAALPLASCSENAPLAASLLAP